MTLDAARKPELNFGLHPTDGAQTNAHPARKSSFGLQLVNHGASKAGDFADLRETENLYGRRNSSGLSRHV